VRRSFESLGRRGQLGRLRRLGRKALAGYGVQDARLRLLRHEHNTSFRVDARGGPYVLRINRPQVHTPATVLSETAWLRALRLDTGLDVPEPVASVDGSFVVVADDPALPEPHLCVLLRWIDGKHVNRRLSATHARRLGILQAQLHEHGVAWAPPAGFARPRVDTLTDASKAASVSGSAEAAHPGIHPTPEDGERALQLVEELVSTADAAAFERGLEIVRGATRQLREEGAGFGLVHGDLHYENVLFHGSETRVIDFDDCGWGFHLYDLAVALWEVEERPGYQELRDALLEAYSVRRPLPDDHARHLRALVLLRQLQVVVWVLESREHPTFRGWWPQWAREELDAIAAAVAST
jgi:Ser/Thr protein kinase RdoA (MazF antagonist)